MKDNCEAAVALGAQGFKVFPVHSPRGDECDCNKRDCPKPAKHPRITEWPTRATSDADQIRAWWGMWPQANIGLATGPGSGVVVVDVDPIHEGDKQMAALVEEHGILPAGPRVKTGSGGWHFYYKHPGTHVPSRNGIIDEGIDVKGDGGYVIAPPSTYHTGVQYEWMYSPDEVAVPEMPAWLHERAIARQDASYGPSGPIVGDVKPGARNSTLTSWAGTLRARGASQAVIFAALMAVNAEWTEPLDRTEVAQVAASIARKEPTAAIPVLSAAPATKKRAAYAPEPFTAADLELEDIPPIKWAVDGFLPEGMAIFGGKAKIGKSWKALNISIAVAEGGIVLDVFPTPEADVLMLALEDNKRRLQGRLRKLMADGRWPARLHLETQWPRVDEGGIDALDAWLGQHPQARLVWIDTLAKFRARPTGKRNDIYAEDYDFGQAVQQLALRHGVCIALITHLNKTLHEDYMDSIQGSAGITGSADTTIYLGRPRGVKGQGAARLRLTGRDIEEQDWAVTFDGATCEWAIQGEFEEQAVGGETRELLEIMAKIGNPVTPEDIAAALKKTRPAAYKLLYRTALDGLIISHKGKLFTLKDDWGGNDENASSMSAVRMSANENTFNKAINDPRTYGQERHADKKDTADTDHQNSFDLAEKSLEPRDMDSEPRALGPRAPTPIGTFKPTKPCSGCGQIAWWSRVGGRWMCEICKPAITPVVKAEDR